MTAVIRQKTAMKETQLLIQILLNWGDADYSKYLYECGLDYLHAYMVDDAAGRKMLEADPLFWNWWKNGFHSRNEEFVLIADTMEMDERINFYHMLHNALDLVRDYRPSRNIVGKAFATAKQH